MLRAGPASYRPSSLSTSDTILFIMCHKRRRLESRGPMRKLQADVGIKDGKIAKIGKLKGHQAKKVIDAGGQVVAP